MDHKGPKKGNQESFTNRRIFIIDHLIEDRKKDKGSSKGNERNEVSLCSLNQKDC